MEYSCPPPEEELLCKVTECCLEDMCGEHKLHTCFGCSLEKCRSCANKFGHVCDVCDQYVCGSCTDKRCPCPKKYNFDKDLLRELQTTGRWFRSFREENIDEEKMSRAFVEGDLLLFEGNKDAVDDILRFGLFATGPGQMSVDDFIGILVRAAEGNRFGCVKDILNSRPWMCYEWHIIRPAIVAIWEVCKNVPSLSGEFNNAFIGVSPKDGIKFSTILEHQTVTRRVTRSMS